MKYLTVICFLLTGIVSTAQTVVTRKTLTKDIKVPIPFGWQKIDDNVSRNIKTKQDTYNIISLYKGEISENLITLYGDSIISKIVLTGADLQRIKAGVEKKTLPELSKISMANVPIERVLSILKQFYKDDPAKFEGIEKNKESILSKAEVTTDTPIQKSLQSKGFYYLVPVNMLFGEVSYSFSLIIGFIRLNNYSYGISGSVEKNNKNDLERFIQNLIALNK